MFDLTINYYPIFDYTQSTDRFKLYFIIVQHIETKKSNALDEWFFLNLFLHLKIDTS